MFEFKDDLSLILNVLKISQKELADELGFDLPTVCNWLNGKFEPDDRSKEDIYSFAYSKKLFINKSHEEPFRHLSKKDNFICLYHGSKTIIKTEPSLDYSKSNNDFGKGFYLGESLTQSSIFVCEETNPHVYAYGLRTKGLKIFEYNITRNWAITIAYYRGRLNKYKDSIELKQIIKQSENMDLLIAPIADNRMFDIIDEFVNGMITDAACAYALNALNLGKQYVLKTNKAMNNLGFLKEFYLCKAELQDYIKEKNQLQQNRLMSIQNFRSENRKGKYLEEIL